MLLEVNSSTRYFLYTGNTDMRKGFDSLSGMVTSQMQFNALSKDVFVFVNRRHTQIKLLQWEGDGFAVYYKRLEKGSYTFPVSEQQQHYISLRETQLQMMLQGISMKRRYRCKRYQHLADNC
jgi:transposase